MLDRKHILDKMRKADHMHPKTDNKHRVSSVALNTAITGAVVGHDQQFNHSTPKLRTLWD